jgi:hypothetical protein
MIGAGLWVRRKDRLKRIHQPRARRDCLGELVQIDGLHLQTPPIPPAPRRSLVPVHKPMFFSGVAGTRWSWDRQRVVGCIVGIGDHWRLFK